MTYKAVLFDLDGTLIDSLEDVADATNGVLEKFGYPTHPVDAYRYFIGEGARKLIERTIPPTEVSEETIQTVLAAYMQAYGNSWNVKTRPYDGMVETLKVLRSQGIKLTVLSNKPHEFTVQCVATFFPEVPFDLVLGQRQGVDRKPHPGGAFEVAKTVDVGPEAFLYVGDSATDMNTATAAGMYAVGVLWGFRTADELSANGARVLIEHPLELLRLIS